MQNPTLIHLLADFSAATPQYTICSALLAQHFPGSPLVSSLQQFKPGESIAPAVFMKLVFREFAAGTFHFCALHIEERYREKYIAARWNQSWFFAPDNGILPMVLPAEETGYFKLQDPQAGEDILREIYLPAALRISNGDMSFAAEDNPVKLLIPAPTRNDNTLRLTVLYTDAAGNAYLNIDKAEFRQMIGERKFKIRLGYRDEIDQLHRGIQEVPMGQKVAFFGAGDLLQIAVNCGSAEQYLGLVKNKILLLQMEDS